MTYGRIERRFQQESKSHFGSGRVKDLKTGRSADPANVGVCIRSYQSHTIFVYLGEKRQKTSCDLNSA
jgi:hypothetical protein